MKKTLLFLYFVSSILLLNAQNYTLKDIVEGRFTAKDIRQMESSADGMHYYQMDPGNTAVIKFSYTTGDAVDTLFNTRRARECTFDTFQGFLVSPDENRVLVYREKAQIYRHSFKATYY